MKILRTALGLTLIELLITVVIIGVLAGLALPSFLSQTPAKNLKNSTRYQISDLRYTRFLAIAQKKTYGITFDLTNKNYKIFEDKVNLANTTFDVGDSVVQTVNLESKVAYGSCTFSNNTIIFKPNGSGSSSGQANLHTFDNSQSFTIDVLGSTGRVKLLSS